MTIQSIQYDIPLETKRLFESLLNSKRCPLPKSAKKFARSVSFSNPSNYEHILPCPLKQIETISALKGVEACIAALICQERYGNRVISTYNYDPDINGGFNSSGTIKLSVDVQNALMFLFMTYLSSIDGLGKYSKGIVHRVKPTDINKAQSDQYRRMSANLYKTRDGHYYHIHGSLEATTTLKMIGLPPFKPELKGDYNKVVMTIQGAVSRYNASELEELNLKNRQAGCQALTAKAFLKTSHGKIISKEPYWNIETLEKITPPVPYPENTFSKSSKSSKPQILKGIKVLELCRIIAGPTISRILAEYGAEVLKVTCSSSLPDVPFFQIDCNMGKHCCDLNLKNPKDRIKFEELLADADVIVDGYRTNAITNLGYGPEKLAHLAEKRNKGYIYVSENCFGFKGEWKNRAGWQQIADCVSGVAWLQGMKLGAREPMVPPFPMSDYGTGCMGAISALVAIYKRAKYGGSYWTTTSLVQYDLLLLQQGCYSEELWSQILSKQCPEIFKLRYYDSVDKISSTTLKSMKKLNPSLFESEKYLQSSYSKGFGGMIKVLKPVVESNIFANEFHYSSRPNGFDPPKWFAVEDCY